MPAHLLLLLLLLLRMSAVHAQGAAAVIGEAGGDISTVLGLEFQEAVTGSACTVTTAALGTCPDCQVR
jgi:hypothetical protein